MLNLSLILGSSGLLGFILMFFWIGKWMGKIEARLDGFDKRFDSIDKKFEALLQEIKEIKISIQNMESRVARLETQDEERFRNEIKLLVSERKKEG